MKRRVAFVAIVVAALMAAAALLAGCAQQADSTKPQLIIGYDEYRPYMYVDDDGNYAGTDAEIAIEACRRMGYEPVFEKIDWQNRDEYLESGQVDCLWSCFSMNEREGEYAWVGPYMISREVVAVRDGSSIYSLADLQGKRVAVKASTKPEEILLTREDARIPQLENVCCLTSSEEVATALRNEYVDAVAGHAAALRYQLAADGVSYRFLDEDLLYAQIGVAFSKDSDVGVRQKLSSALSSMRADGTTRGILVKYGLDPEKTLEGVGQ